MAGVVVLSNIRFDVLRPSFDSTSSVTSQPTYYLSRVKAFGEPMYAHQYTGLPSSALAAQFLFNVLPRVDIQIGDVITNVTELDNVTPWPQDVPTSSNAHITWHVCFVRVTAPRILSSRIIYLKRVITGGPAHP